jgi:hypothetical protein
MLSVQAANNSALPCTRLLKTAPCLFPCLFLYQRQGQGFIGLLLARSKQLFLWRREVAQAWLALPAGGRSYT